MFKTDMELKREKTIDKVWKAINKHGGTTLLSTGITGDDARMAKAAVDAGTLMLEPNHPAVALARGLDGVTTMNDAEAIRYKVPLEEMLKVTSGVRTVVGEDVYITVGVPGGFTEAMPINLKDEDYLAISQAGADGLHVHKSGWEDLEEIVNKAHKYGLIVDTYIDQPSDTSDSIGISAETPEEVAKVAEKMEKIGVDMIGLMTGMTYQGGDAGEIHPDVKKRLNALINAVDVPTLAEGGINLDNYKAFGDTGVNVLVVGTSFDDLAKDAVAGGVQKYISLKNK